MATSLKSLITVMFFISITNKIGALPRSWYNSSEISLVNNSYLQLHQKTKGSDHLQTQRKILSRGTASVTDDDSGKDGKIVFPTESPPLFLPIFNPICENATFCESTSNYPTDFIDNIVRMNKDLNLFSGADLVPDVVHRLNVNQDDGNLCNSYEKVVYPKVAQSKDKELLFVVNHGDFIQGVRVEICGDENNECTYIGGFAEGYKTFCKQKYIYRHLVSISSAGQLKPDMFSFPASCCCHIKFSGSPLIRLGGSSNKKNETPISKAHR